MTGRPKKEDRSKVRDQMLRIMVTVDEKIMLESLADNNGKSLSSYVRKVLKDHVDNIISS